MIMEEEKINLCEILKDHIGEEFFCTIFGCNATLELIQEIDGKELLVVTCVNPKICDKPLYLTSEGKMFSTGIPILFPSENRRDWKRWHGFVKWKQRIIPKKELNPLLNDMPLFGNVYNVMKINYLYQTRRDFCKKLYDAIANHIGSDHPTIKQGFLDERDIREGVLHLVQLGFNTFNNFLHSFEID